MMEFNEIRDRCVRGLSINGKVLVQLTRASAVNGRMAFLRGRDVPWGIVLSAPSIEPALVQFDANEVINFLDRLGRQT